MSNAKQHVLAISYCTPAKDVENRINSFLEDGWVVVSVTAQHIATGSTRYADGGYLVVLQEQV